MNNLMASQRYLKMATTCSILCSKPVKLRVYQDPSYKSNLFLHLFHAHGKEVQRWKGRILKADGIGICSGGINHRR